MISEIIFGVLFQSGQLEDQLYFQALRYKNICDVFLKHLQQVVCIKSKLLHVHKSCTSISKLTKVKY